MIYLFTGNDFFHTFRDKTFATIGTVVGQYNNLIGILTYLILEYQKFFVACSDNRYYLVAGFLHCLNNGKQRGNSYSTTTGENCSEVLNMSGLTKGSYYVENGVAGLQRRQLARADANLLDNQGDGTFD